MNLADIIARSTGEKGPLLITKMQLKLKRAIIGTIVLKECEQQSRNLHQPSEPWSTCLGSWPFDSINGLQN